MPVKGRNKAKSSIKKGDESVGVASNFSKPQKSEELIHSTPGGSLSFLLVCVLGIYGSFLTWAILQERISTTPYGDDMRIFRASYAISAVQSFFAFIAGTFFLYYASSSSEKVVILPKNPELIKYYMTVALCYTLSTPFTYASLKHVDYITMLLAKSCKLVPVMAVDLFLYRTKFPAYKYVVVMMVTLGVSLFSLYSPGQAASSGIREGSSVVWGLSLLGCGLLLDGVYNTTQDQMFRKFKGSGQLTGPHMMSVFNLFTTIFSLGGMILSDQLGSVMWFMRHHPRVFVDIAVYGLCGAVGQIFIFLTLERFGSLVLVTTTITRKMISMLISVVLFNHKLSGMQWVGVICVFGGIAGEALYKQLRL